MPWIFLCLMLANAVYFGWKFMEGTQPQARAVSTEVAQSGAKILLLSEKPELAAPVIEDKAPEPAPAETPATPVIASGPQCFNVGPFTSDAPLQKFLGPLQDKRFTARVDKRKVDAKDYWVFVPAFTNREKAEERLRELKSRGIDGFIVKEGVFVNTISLNHFSRKDLAQAFQQKMKEAGVGVEFREISQPGVERWIYLAPGHGKADLRGQIDAQLAKQDGLKRENASCEE